MPFSLLGGADTAKWSCKNTHLAVFTLVGSRKCLQQKAPQAKKECLPSRDKGDQRESSEASCPGPAPQAPPSFSAGCTLSESIVHFCLPFLPEKEEVILYPPQGTFPLAFLDGL